MGRDQRTAIRKALNEDAEKLLAEGNPSDPQLFRLKREMAEVNALFDEFERRARAEEETMHAGRIFNNQISLLQQSLEDFERILLLRTSASVPQDLKSLHKAEMEHKDFKASLDKLSPDIEQVQKSFLNIAPKTHQMKNNLEKVINKWNYLWDLSNLYSERLERVKILLSELEESVASIDEFESKLSYLEQVPPDAKEVQSVFEGLVSLQHTVKHQQHQVDQLMADFSDAKRATEKSRIGANCRESCYDLDTLESRVNRVKTRWTGICKRLANKLRNLETAFQERKYVSSYEFVPMQMSQELNDPRVSVILKILSKF